MAPYRKRTTADPRSSEAATRAATELIASGIGIGVLGTVAAVISGAVCPVCVVAAPALIGVGAYRRWRAARPRLSPTSRSVPRLRDGA
jgi:hypothetical protein